MDSSQGSTALSAPLRSYLLADGRLSLTSVANLLLSSSFGANAVFYAAWLGYMMGLWALLVHLFWALSFILLSTFSDRFRQIDSLHDSIGQSFGNGAKITASLCSLVGIAYFVGWEVAIARNIMSASTAAIGGIPQSGSQLLLSACIAFALAYTLVGGISTNAAVNKVLNALKVVSLLCLCIVLLSSLPDGFFAATSVSAMIPSIESGLLALGLFGLLTNLLFNLSWQFVDNSTWQSVIAGSRDSGDKVRSELRASGAVIFATIGFFGTLLGASARAYESFAPEELFVSFIGAVPGSEVVVAVLLLVLSCACVMSLIDGMLLAASQTAAADILSTLLGKTVEMYTCRLVLIFIAVVSIWGVEQVISYMGGSIFDFVYFLIISQLAIIGPSILSLLGLSFRSGFMVAPILMALCVGFGMVVVGTASGTSLLIDAAGAATILTSIIVALVVFWGMRLIVAARNKTRRVCSSI